MEDECLERMLRWRRGTLTASELVYGAVMGSFGGVLDLCVFQVFFYRHQDPAPDPGHIFPD